MDELERNKIRFVLDGEMEGFRIQIDDDECLERTNKDEGNYQRLTIKIHWLGVISKVE